MKTVKRKKLPKRSCLGCGEFFTPSRVDQVTHNASCRYKRYTQSIQRLRVKAFDTAASVWHYVKANTASEPCAWFLDRADAKAWAQILRRRQRKQPITERVRFAIGLMLPRQNPGSITVEAESKPVTRKGIGKSKTGLSINPAVNPKKKKNAE